ncbi:MAG TPA: pentapeptide repeat-containing protein [Cyclobacteriaceae bacterium]|nr:pentapeptide repeat-containing protein [Cyclobacteriaceae bacterium]
MRLKLWIKYELPKYNVIIFFILLSLISLVVIIFLDKTDSNFNKHDILVEAHGLVFDLFVFGILITIFDFLRNRKESRSRYYEEIEDLIGWKSEEAKIKILAKVKRLYDLGQRRFFLSNSYLKNANLSDYDLTDSIIVLANLKKASFIRSNLKNVQLNGSKLNKVYFTSANLENTDLSNAICKGTFFTATDLVNTNFKQTDLRRASFISCYYKDINMEDAKLDEVVVDNLNWFESLRDSGANGIENLENKYFINPESKKDEDGYDTYLIERIKTSTQ